MGKISYLTPLDIPTQTIGDYEIRQTTQTAGHEFNLNNVRTSFFGQKGGKVSWDHETKWHTLLRSGVRLMSDIPMEQKQHNEALRGFKGRVLVGGLGIGYALAVLFKKPSVKEVVCIEIAQEVIDMVKPHVNVPKGKTLTVIQSDLLQWVKDYEGSKFDHAFYDIWSSDGEGTFFDTVCPLYDLSQGKVKRPPINWNEDVMRGQLLWSLTSRLNLLTSPIFADALAKHVERLPPLWEHDGTERPWHNWSVPFYKWWHDNNPDEETTEAMVKLYAAIYGRWNWRDLWDIGAK